ncbi:MAG: hypothetical protein JSW34_06945 [Candidatus Zixiibacteriota bacterium]|nr:MAG: hypothetical protein JSW34_06945 [candidate division Zixibacteria bacterium]
MRCLRYSLVSQAVLLLTALLVPASVGGISFESEKQVHISNLHRMDDDLIAWASNVTIDGLIEGDFIAGAWRVNVNGHIRGSENVVAENFRHTGKVDGGLRAFVKFCDIDGYVGRSALLAGSDVRVGKRAVIEREAYIIGETIHFDGIVKENIQIKGNNVFVSGMINGDALIKGTNINIVAPAVIKGSLTYESKNKAVIEIDSGVTVLGETTWKKPDPDEEYDDVTTFASIIVGFAKMLAAFLFGVILLMLFKKYALESVRQLRSRPAVVTATGLLSLVIFVVSVVILLISLVLLVVGVILIEGDDALAGVVILALSILMVPITSFITVSGGVLFYSGRVILALLIGYLLVKMLKPQAELLSRFQLLIGLVSLTLALSSPFAGLLLYLIVGVVGAGAIVLGIKYCRREFSEQPPAAPQDSDAARPGTG